MNIREKFGVKIKELRLEKKLSQEAFAHLAGLDRTYISNIEKGERNVSLEVIQKISKVFEITLSELFTKIDL